MEEARGGRPMPRWREDAIHLRKSSWESFVWTAALRPTRWPIAKGRVGGRRGGVKKNVWALFEFGGGVESRDPPPDRSSPPSKRPSRPDTIPIVDARFSSTGLYPRATRPLASAGAAGARRIKSSALSSMANIPPTWEQFKQEHPPGSEVTGIVRQVAQFGVFVDLGVPFTALLLVPYIAPVGQRKSYPDDYPKVGDVISVLIRHFGDQIAPNGVGAIALTQDPESLWTADAR
jgi:hypothetical protein